MKKLPNFISKPQFHLISIVKKIKANKILMEEKLRACFIVFITEVLRSKLF